MRRPTLTPLRQVAASTWAEARADDIFGRAAQLAYFFFLALFPFLIFVIAALSVAGEADFGRRLLFHSLAHVLPPAAYSLVDRTFLAIIHSGGPLKMSLGIVISIWSASMGMSAVMDTLDTAYEVPETRSMMKQYAVAIALTVAFAILGIAYVATAVIAGHIVNGPLRGTLIANVWTIAQWPMEIALILLAFDIVYHFAPNLPVHRWRWLTPGSVLGLTVWMAASIGLRIYIHFATSYNATYGPLGAVIILLLWFYLSGIAILSGAILNAVLEKRRPAHPRPHRVPAPIPRPAAPFPPADRPQAPGRRAS